MPKSEPIIYNNRKLNRTESFWAEPNEPKVVSVRFDFEDGFLSKTEPNKPKAKPVNFRVCSFHKGIEAHPNQNPIVIF